MNKVGYLVSCREKALRQGDQGQVRAIDADLQRLGVQTPVFERAVPAPLETPEAGRDMAKRPGRRPMPRCEHNKIVGRCQDCEEDD